MISVHTNWLPFEWGRRAVFIIHALCASVLPNVAHKGLRAVGVILASGPGIPGGLFLFHHWVHGSVPPDHQGGGDAKEKREDEK